MRLIQILILTAVCFKLFLPMRASGSVRPEHVLCRTHMVLGQTRYWDRFRQNAGRLFSTSFAYDQHRHSPALHNTACRSLHDENRINVTAVPRANMSTAAVERRPAKRMRGGHTDIFDILNVLSVTKIFSNRAYPLRVPRV